MSVSTWYEGPVGRNRASKVAQDRGGGYHPRSCPRVGLARLPMEEASGGQRVFRENPLSESSENVKADGHRAAAGGGEASSRRVAINTVSNWVGLVAQVGVNFFLLGYVLNRLEENNLVGVFGLATSVSVGVAMLAPGMAGSVLRVASESIAAGDWGRLSRVLSVSRALLSGAGALGVAGVFVLTTLLLGVLNVPEEHRPAAALLMQLVALAAAPHLVRVAYRGALCAKQRFDLANGVAIFEMVVRGAIVVGCFRAGWVRVEAFGVASAVASALALVCMAGLTRWVIPQARIPLLVFDREALRSVLGFGAWNAVNQLTRQAQDQGGVALVSAIPRLAMSGVAAITIPKFAAPYMVAFVNGLSLTLWPVAAVFAARGERENLARLYRLGTRLAAMMAVPVLAVLGTHGMALVGCVREDLAETGTLLVVYMALFALRVTGLPAEHIIMGSGQVRGVALSQLAAAGVGLGVAAAIGWLTDWGLMAVVVALFAPAAVRGLVYLPYRIREDTGVGFWESMSVCLLPPILAGAVPVAMGLGLKHVWAPDRLWEVLAQMVVCGGAYAVVGWFVVLGREERGLMLRTVMRRRVAKVRAGGTPGPGASGKG